jgi:hypothetical protein
MSETAQVALAVVCFSVAVLAGLSGITLVVVEGRRTSSALRRWRDGPSARTEPDSAVPRAELVRVVDLLLGDPVDRATAVALLLVGVLTGALGGFLSLTVGS